MNISKQEAQASLSEIENIIAQTRREIAAGGASLLLVIWGAIWIAGFSGMQFFPKSTAAIWLALDAGGFAATWLILRKSAQLSPASRRAGLAWVVVFGYMMLWDFLLHPHGMAEMAFLSTVPMCVYVICGLWFGRFWVWLGLIVTALTVAGLVMMGTWFPMWMAITGGGSLIVSGLFIRKFWK